MTKGTCSIDGCSANVVARGWCNRHYLRWRNHGEPTAGGPSPTVRRAQDLPDGRRVCAGCRRTLALTEFDRDPAGSLGRRSRCKECRSAHMKAYYAKDPERFREYERTRRRELTEHMRALDAERYERHREKRIALASEHAHTRRIRMQDAPMDRWISRASLRRRDGEACCYCGVQMTFRAPRKGEYLPMLATIEHIVPVSKGGTHTWDNVTLACWRCNIARGNRDANPSGGRVGHESGKD